jgi:hypothetical protein
MNTIDFQKDSRKGGVLGKLLLVMATLFVIGAIAWVLLLPRLVAAQIHSQTGFNATVDHLSVNPFTANIEIDGLVLKNPAGWPVDNFLELRQFKADGSLTSFFSSKIVANEVILDVGRCTVVRDKKGALNATVFSNALNGKSKAPAAAAGQPHPAAKTKEFLIKHMVLKFDTLVYADYSGATPTTKEYDLKLSSDLHDVDSVAKIVKPITSASIGVLADALTGALNGRTNLLKDATGAIGDAGKKAGEKLKGLLDSLDKKKR